ncbi:hypothetical protein [uncultured Thiodictyon sp.]|jgi:hypothetical protein|uniref:hypothetical protein n=1 Tax=uncultured Thiodictyon sp. TaxID=1846217 RepID=UPI0025D7BFCF|nr:hypothetical protein [uncultured Thiodictyon sp.]
MSDFLWIEDFEGDLRATVDQVFGLAGCPTAMPDLKAWLGAHGITLKTTFFDAYRLVRDPAQLAAIDYVVIDIDLKPYEDYDLDDPQAVAEIDRFLREKRYLKESAGHTEPLGPAWRAAVSELKKVAGYHIFTELLIEAGFPKRHILFCSNHGDQLTSIASAFEAAKLAAPVIYTKRDETVRRWIADKQADAYSVLRRGILMGCAAAEDLMDRRGDDGLVFSLFFKREDEPEWPPGPASPDYVRDYLASMTALLPLCAPTSTEQRKQRYRILLHALSREWDNRAKVNHLPDKSTYMASYGTILKEVRNWASHTQLLDDLSEADVAFIFMADLRAMFAFPRECQPHERLLLGLLGRTFGELAEGVTADLIGADAEGRRLPLDRIYFETKRMLGERRSADDNDPYYDQLIRELEKDTPNRVDERDRQFFLQSLYRMFWFYPSRMRRVKYGWTPVSDTGEATLFRHCDFSRTQRESFAFQLARRILIRAFPESFASLANPAK